MLLKHLKINLRRSQIYKTRLLNTDLEVRTAYTNAIGSQYWSIRNRISYNSKFSNYSNSNILDSKTNSNRTRKDWIRFDSNSSTSAWYHSTIIKFLTRNLRDLHIHICICSQLECTCATKRLRYIATTISNVRGYVGYRHAYANATHACEMRKYLVSHSARMPIHPSPILRNIPPERYICYNCLLHKCALNNKAGKVLSLNFTRVNITHLNLQFGW